MSQAPVRQKTTLAQPIAPPPKKPQLKKIFRQFHQEISRLPPTRFTYFPTNPDNPFSLPDTIAKILHHQDLINIDGQPLYKNKRQLANPVFKRQLEAKLNLSLVDHTAQLNYFQKLAPLAVNLSNKSFRSTWTTAARIICEELAKEASIAFSAEYFHHQFLGIITPNPPPLKPANQKAKKAVTKYLKAHAKKTFPNLFTNFFSPLQTINNKHKSALTKLTISTIKQQIPSLDPIPQRFSLRIESQPFLNLTIHYPD